MNVLIYLIPIALLLGGLGLIGHAHRLGTTQKTIKQAHRQGTRAW